MNIQHLKALILREFWEHNGMMLRTPIILCIALVVITSIATLKAVSFSSENNLNFRDSSSFSYEFSSKNSNSGNTSSSHYSGSGNEAFNQHAVPQIKQSLKDSLQQKDLRPKIVSVFVQTALFISLIIAVFYLGQALFTDRKDKSILFWRSLPVAEYEVVLAKLITGTWVFPLVFLGISLVGAAVCLLIAYIGATVMGLESIVSTLLLETGAYSFTGSMQFMLYMFALITALLPFNCWMLACSAYAKRAPSVAAIGVPIAIAIIEGVALQSSHFINAISTFFARQYHNAIALSQWQLDSVSWSYYGITLVVSAALIFATIWLRNNRYEI